VLPMCPVRNVTYVSGRTHTQIRHFKEWLSGLSRYRDRYRDK